MNKQKHLSVKLSSVSTDWGIWQWWCFAPLWLSASSSVASNAVAQTEIWHSFHWCPLPSLAPGCQRTTETLEHTVISRKDGIIGDYPMHNGMRVSSNRAVFSLETHLSVESRQVYVWSKCSLSLAIVLVRLKQSIKNPMLAVCTKLSLCLKNHSTVSEREKGGEAQQKLWVFIKCKAMPLLLYPEKPMRQQSVISFSPVWSKFVRLPIDSVLITSGNSSLWLWFSICSNIWCVIFLLSET